MSEHDAPLLEPETDLPVRDADGGLDPRFVAAVEDAIEASDVERLRELAGDLHEADLGELLGVLSPDEQPQLVRLLGDDFDFTALTEIDETVRVRLLEALSPRVVADGVRDLDSDDAVYLLEDLDEDDKQAILEQMSVPERLRLVRALDYPEESAGRRMQTDFVAVPPFWTVGQTIDFLRVDDDLPETFYEIFVVEPTFRLIGTVPLDRLLKAKRPTKISEVMHEEQQIVRATDDQEDVARLFKRYNLVSVAVVDEAQRLVGMLTVDDIVDVIEEEAEEDIRAMAGVGDEELSDTVAYTARSRLPWLVINTATAFLAASVIGIFDGTIEQMVALAVLMPIVASMGGNAGTQAMTVTVRALATREISRRNAGRIIRRELLVGLLNGVVLAALVGGVAGAWFLNWELGCVIAAALIGNLVVAGLFGVLIPLTLNARKIDPAVASGVFLTTVTDVVGFSLFLGIAAWWFGLW
ncbi:magnesium transporter [Pseudoxanthobacter sp. M-2]|uniref:magnesium transporter n=1 Tax=Pseudoxanthobacter sp. M-2 TaxID=3078754 RepID=UPI0038FCAD65